MGREDRGGKGEEEGEEKGEGRGERIHSFSFFFSVIHLKT